MYSAQSGPFLNSIHNPGAATAAFTGVSNPLGLSINNAFGRLWPANAPYGLGGIGSSTILDPSGEPLAGAPDPQLGGVYAGNLTPRLPAQIIPGALNSAAVGTALLGRSPNGSTKAVFAVVCADGRTASPTRSKLNSFSIHPSESAETINIGPRYRFIELSFASDHGLKFADAT